MKGQGDIENNKGRTLDDNYNKINENHKLVSLLKWKKKG